MSQPPYICELTRRRYRGRVPDPICGPDDVVKLIDKLTGNRFRTEVRECFMVILLNARHEALAVETVSIGSLNSSIVHPREVFRPAIMAAAAAIILVHNHPSGNPEPSEEDISITKRLVESGKLLGIPVLDHIISARRGATSLQGLTLME